MMFFKFPLGKQKWSGVLNAVDVYSRRAWSEFIKADPKPKNHKAGTPWRMKTKGGKGQQSVLAAFRRAHSPQPRVAPRRNLGDAAIFCHAVSELLLADGLTKLVVARNRSQRRPNRKSPRRTGRPMVNLELYVRPPSAHAIGELPAVSRRGGMPDAPTGPAGPVLVPHTPPELSYRTLTTVK